MNASQPIKGLSLYSTARNWPVMRVHYSCDPEKTESWAAKERATYQSKALWAQEQDIVFGVGGGERLLRDLLLARFKEIVIRDENWKPQSNWQWAAGFDYGQSSPSAWTPICRDHYGVHYAVAEHYQSGSDWTPRRHAQAMASMGCIVGDTWRSYLQLISGNTYADPRVFDQTHAQSRGEYASIYDMYQSAFLDQYGARMPDYEFDGIAMKPGMKGDDIGFVNRLLQMWSAPDPLFKIILHPRYTYTRKQEGTYPDGCPNLIWELMGIRRQKLSATQLDTRSPLESIVQKANHLFDGTKYYFSSRPSIVTFSREELWDQKADQFNRQFPERSEFERTNQLIRMREQFEADKPKEESLTWH